MHLPVVMIIVSQHRFPRRRESLKVGIVLVWLCSQRMNPSSWMDSHCLHLGSWDGITVDESTESLGCCWAWERAVSEGSRNHWNARHTAFADRGLGCILLRLGTRFCAALCAFDLEYYWGWPSTWGA